MVTPATLFKYVDKFARRHENTGKGTVYPTLRQTAKHFRTTISEIEEVADDYCELGYLGLVVGVGIPGAGYADLLRGQWQVEAYA